MIKILVAPIMLVVPLPLFLLFTQYASAAKLVWLLFHNILWQRAGRMSAAEKVSAAGDSSDEEIYNPTKIPGDNVWEPDPQTIIRLYEKLDKVSAILITYNIIADIIPIGWVECHILKWWLSCKKNFLDLLPSTYFVFRVGLLHICLNSCWVLRLALSWS